MRKGGLIGVVAKGGDGNVREKRLGGMEQKRETGQSSAVIM